MIGDLPGVIHFNAGSKNALQVVGFKRDISKVDTHVLNTEVLDWVASSDTLHDAFLCLGKFNNEPEILTKTEEYVRVLFKERTKLRKCHLEYCAALCPVVEYELSGIL